MLMEAESLAQHGRPELAKRSVLQMKTLHVVLRMQGNENMGGKSPWRYN